MDAWEQLYEAYGITEFMHYIESPELQDIILPVKILFILFSMFFLCAIAWFYLNSSYLRFNVFQDTKEFFSWQPYGLRSVSKRWEKIKKIASAGGDAELKLAIIDADELLYKTFEDKGYQGETFEQLAAFAERKGLENLDDVLEAHNVRNSIVYAQDYVLDSALAKRVLAIYEIAVKKVAEG